jgi:predicted membrane chloride channel (bestrophin family)
MVHARLVFKLNYYFRQGWIPGAPVHATVLKQLDVYTSHLAQLLTVDRTPLPYSYVQMTSSLLCLFVLTLPFSLTAHVGRATPLVAAIFAFAYGESVRVRLR